MQETVEAALVALVTVTGLLAVGEQVETLPLEVVKVIIPVITVETSAGVGVSVAVKVTGTVAILVEDDAGTAAIVSAVAAFTTVCTSRLLTGLEVKFASVSWMYAAVTV